jgi:D-alanyl-D-alanine carboxypeptidase (penicillin-binding protein 5/6)
MEQALRVWRYAVFLLAALLCLASGAGQAQTFQTSAPFAILVDYDSGTVLLEKNADQLMAPASTSKIMTAEIVFRELAEGRLKLDDTMTVSVNAWRKGGASSGGSTMFAKVNSQIRVEDLLRGLIIDSGNDAAITLAEGIAGTEDAFAAMMTKRARELGLTQSTFANPWGKGDPQEKVTAREMAKLAAHVIKTYPQFYKYFGEQEFTWDKIRQRNRNPLLFMNIGADGLKTGDINESGFGLVGSAVQNGQRLILVINGMKTARERAEEGRKLLEWGFRAFEAKQMFAADETIGTARVYGGEQSEVPLVAGAPVKLLVPRGSDSKLVGKIVYRGPLIAPVQEGVEVARLKVWRGTTELLDVPLKTANSVAVGSLPKRAFDAGVELATNLLLKSFSKN